MATSTALVTVEEFRKLEDPPGIRLELHNGEVVKVGRPKPRHWFLQRRLMKLLESILGDHGCAGTEFAFRCKPEFELRAADVAWVSFERLNAMNLEIDFEAPEIVIEVLSPSNSTAEMLEKKELCLKAGCNEFWIVDPKREVIEITRATGSTVFYHRGDQIPIGNRTCGVDDIFAADRAQ